jgi:hypothetical protein
MEPTLIVAGDTASWLTQLEDYPAPSWVLTYYLARNGAAPTAVAAAADGLSHLVTIPAATTSAYVVGAYHWTAIVTKGTERFTVGRGTMQVDPDPSTTHDPRTHGEKCLASIETALESAVGTATVECELDGVRVRKDRKELLELREYYRLEVRRERGKSPITRWPVRLVR